MTSESGAIEGVAILFAVKPNKLEAMPANTSPETSDTSQDPHPSTAFANSAVRVRNRRILPSCAQVAKLTCNRTTASSVFTSMSRNSVAASCTKAFCAEVKLKIAAITDLKHNPSKPPLSIKNDIRQGTRVGKV